ncbi:Pleiotropic drug resistance protein 6, partial [Tetrabaena socialis]
DTVLGVMDVMGVMFTSTLFLSMTNLLMVMPVVAADRSVYYRERASGMYHAAAFAWAQGVAELPFLFVQSVVYVVIVYCTVHFEFTAAKMMWFWLYLWLDLMLFTFMGVAAMNIAPNMPAATAGCSFLILLWNLFCGFLIYRRDIKPWYLWAYYFNPPTYIIYGCVTTQMGDLTDTLIDTGEGVMTSVAQYVADTFDYDYNMRGWIVLILVGFIFACRGLAYFGLMRLNFQRR